MVIVLNFITEYLFYFFFFFNDTATTEIYTTEDTLSLHDALPIFFLRTVQGDPQLRPQDVAFANTIAQAAARVLENEERRAAIYRRQISAGVTDVLTGCASLDALDRRLREEFERARRYSLRFALVV